MASWAQSNNFAPFFGFNSSYLQQNKAVNSNTIEINACRNRSLCPQINYLFEVVVMVTYHFIIYNFEIEKNT